MITTLVLIWLASFVVIFGVLEFVSSDLEASFSETAKPFRVLVLFAGSPFAVLILSVLIAAIGVCSICDWVVKSVKKF